MVKYFRGLFKNKKTKEEKKRILKLRTQLVELGFHPEEVDYLIHMYAQNEDLGMIDPKTDKWVEEALKNHLDIAKKCLSLVKNN